ncbi:MAG: efflux RND transporter periplasmic adaptor subunit [Pseudomonadota bacterium]
MSNGRDGIEATLGLDSRSHRLRNWGFAGAAAIAVVGGVVWFGSGATQETIQYVTAPVERAGFSVLVTATGTVEPTNLVEVSSELSGTLEKVNVDYNDTVVVGYELARLDTTTLEAQLAVSRAQLDAAIARVARARASLDDARTKFESARALDERGTTSRQAFISAQAEFRRASADLQTAQADQALAEATVDLNQATFDKACICSPIDGVILDRAVDPGQIVAATLSAPVLFTIAEDLTQMELHVDIDEADIGRVQVGNPAKFTVDAYEERRFPAEITEVRFAPQTVDGVVTYQAILTIDNSDLLLRPGMTATADITVATVTDALVVPNAALRYAPPPVPSDADDEDRSGLLGMLIPSGPTDGPVGDAKTVWVLVDDAATEVPVETGETNGRVTEILGGEILEGDAVVTDQRNG